MLGDSKLCLTRQNFPLRALITQQRKTGSCSRVPGCASKNVSSFWSVFLLLCSTLYGATGDYLL